MHALTRASEGVRKAAVPQEAQGQFRPRSATSAGFGTPDSAAGSGDLRGLPETSVVAVPLSEIEVSDTRFQWRLNLKPKDLRDSLRREGQQEPVILWGDKPPFVLIDGFRRAYCARELGWTEIKAIIREDVTEQQAFRLSFIANVARRNLSRLEQAHAIWSALHQKRMTKEGIAEAFGISVRQVERYLEIVNYPAQIQEALLQGSITMGHANLLSKAMGIDLGAMLKRLSLERLSVPDLRRALKGQARVVPPRRHFQRLKNGFRIYGFKVDENTSEAEKDRLRKSLETALEILNMPKDAPPPTPMTAQ